MAKTYNLKADAQFLITDSASNTINSIDTTHTFPTISSDTVVTGTVAIASGATEQLNITTLGARAILFLKNDNSVGLANIRLYSNTTLIATIQPQEWLFVPVDAVGTNVNVEALSGAADITYILIEQ